MNTSAFGRLWQRFDVLEGSLCLRMNSGCRHPTIRRAFALVSRLGDGIFWYALMVGLALSGRETATVSARMALAGLVGAALYKWLKSEMVRERPYIGHAGIVLGTAPLDKYSFPSGHTLHAVSFTTIASASAPELALILVPFTAMVAASRVVLGLHYPTDVAAGALIGGALGSATLWLS